MRKILLATTALVGFAAFAPTAQAQTKDSPLNVNIGGYVDFRAGLIAGSNDAFPTTDMRSHGFLTEYKINMDIDGKAAKGIEYGGRISLTNAATFSGFSGGADTKTAEAYVYLAGAYGKAVLGDHNGASDLFVYAPTVGLGQVDGQYTNFIDLNTVGAFMPSYIENGSDYSTKITYMTPKVGNDKHKVQLGVSYGPSNGFQGQQVAVYDSPSSYRNNLEAGFQYQGEFSPVSVVFSGYLQSGVGGDVNSTFFSHARDYIAWGVGTQLAYAGFTFGGSYVDAGSYNTFETSAGLNQDKEQNVWTLGAKYEQNKYAVAVNYMRAKGYRPSLSSGGSGTAADQDYVKSFNAYSVGGTYTWFPGMATQLDYVFFNQKRDDTTSKAAGSVVVVSQKLTF